MERALCAISLLSAIVSSHRFNFIDGDGFVAVLGNPSKPPSVGTTSLPQPPWISSTETMFFLTRQTNATRVEAMVAPGIIAEAELPYGATDAPAGGGGGSTQDLWSSAAAATASGGRQAILLDVGVTLTAHVVTGSMGSSAVQGEDGSQPSVDVVLHADGPPLTTAKACFRVLALRNNGRERVTASCFLAPVEGIQSSSGAAEAGRSSGGSNGSDSASGARASTACLARLALPLDWTIAGGTVDVKFAQAAGGAEQCFRASNSVKHATEEDAVSGSWYSAGRVQLVAESAAGPGGVGYKEVQEDQHILLAIPDSVLRPGSTFTVPVRLQAESDLQIFIAKIRTSRDLRLLDARTADASTWSVSFEPEEKGGSVTALVRSSETYTKMPKVQDVFYCQFEVLQSAQTGADGRITWTIEYESSYTDMNFVSTERKVITARLKIGSDQIKHVAVAAKHNDIFNLRLFRDQTLSFPIWVYTVSYTGALKAVTAADGVQCVSRNPKILQVTKKCDGVYVPSGAASCGTANIDVQFAQRSRTVMFRVWCPDERLIIELSDDRLNEVREWRVPLQGNGSNYRRDPLAADQLPCKSRYQTADVRIFTRLYTYDRDGQVIYYRGGGKAAVLSDVTSLVQPFIRTADSSIAIYKGGVLVGVSKGRTEVQVVLGGGRLVAARDVLVLRAKESLERFAVAVVSGASLSVSRRGDIAGVYVASLGLEDKLDSKHQEAILDIWLKFTDGAFSALSSFDSTDYRLQVESQNPAVVEFVTPVVEPHQPRIRAVSSGRAMVKVTLLGPPECLPTQQQRSGATAPPAVGSSGGGVARPLAMQFIYVSVDMGPEGGGGAHDDDDAENSLASDYEHESSSDPAPGGSVGRRPSLGGGKKSKESAAYQNDAAPQQDSAAGFSPRRQPGAGGPAAGAASQHSSGHAAAAGAAAVPAVAAAAVGAAHSAAAGKPVTPLDVGMYVVAGVLGVIVAVLAANCIVYARRQKLGLAAAAARAGRGIVAAAVTAVPAAVGGGGGAAPVKPSSGWVWIGRGTLEKHAVSTSCGEFMPEPDFARRYSQCAPGGGGAQTMLTVSSSRTSCSVRRSTSCGAAGGGSMYRGSECSIRMTMTSRDGSGFYAGGGGRCSSGASSDCGGGGGGTAASTSGCCSSEDEEDDRPIITPDDADGDSYGSEPLLARDVGAQRAAGDGLSVGAAAAAAATRESLRCAPDVRRSWDGSGEHGEQPIERQRLESGDDDEDQRSSECSVDVVCSSASSIGVGEAPLTQIEFDNLRESVA